MPYNKQVNPYGIASSELDWKGFADGGSNTNPGTPTVNDPWWTKGAAALASNLGGRMFDSIVSGASKESFGKYGGESQEAYDQDPGKAYRQGNTLFDRMRANNKSEAEANEAAYQKFKQMKIDQLRGSADNKNGEYNSDERANDYFESQASRGKYDTDSKQYLTDEQGWTKTNPNFSPDYKHYMLERRRWEEAQKELNARQKGWLKKDNVGKKLVKTGFGDLMPNKLYGDPKKGEAFYSDAFKDSKTFDWNPFD